MIRASKLWSGSILVVMWFMMISGSIPTPNIMYELSSSYIET